MSPSDKQCLGCASGTGIPTINQDRGIPAAGSAHKETGFRVPQDAENARRGVWLPSPNADFDFTSESDLDLAAPKIVETHPIKLYDGEQMATLKLAAYVTGGLFVLLAMGLTAITVVALSGVAASQVIDYFKIIVGPVFSLAMFIAGYALRGRAIDKG